jgi:hypothetical protein
MPVDRNKKSNVKCENCVHYYSDFCHILNRETHYWNRCGEFEWNEKKVKEYGKGNI